MPRVAVAASQRLRYIGAMPVDDTRLRHAADLIAASALALLAVEFGVGMLALDVPTDF